MKYVIASAALLAALSANAAPPCSIHAKAGLSDAELPALAKVTREVAEATALHSVKIPSAAIVGGELENEGGCLIYSFDIRVPGKKWIFEVAVDAGTGKVLSTTREGPKAQAAEEAADAAAAKKQSKKSQ